MRKVFFAALMTLAISEAYAQSNCDADVVENLTAEIQNRQNQVEMTWDYNCPFSSCSSNMVHYTVEYQFGIKPNPFSQLVDWFYSGSLSHSQSESESVHSVSVPTTTSIEYFKYRVKVNGCSNWDGWVTVSIFN